MEEMPRNSAKELEAECLRLLAMDPAIASVEQARLAVLDAIDGRLAAEQAKRS